MNGLKIRPKAKGSVKVYRVSSDGRFAKDYSLRDQLRRAAVSVMLNIAEGLEDKQRIYTVSCYSMVRLLRSISFEVAIDQKYISQTHLKLFINARMKFQTHNGFFKLS